MTSIQVEVLSSPQEWGRLRAAWQEIVDEQSQRIEGLDVTCSFDWTMALWETHLKFGKMEILVLRENNEITGILPVYWCKRSICWIPCQGIAPMQELYSGRSGFLLREPTLARLQALFRHLQTDLNPWDVMTVTLPKGSVQEKLFLEMTAANAFQVRPIEEQHSPFISLQDNWERHFASLPKKFRATIRNGGKRLRERGELGYRECVGPQAVADFNAAVIEIEKDSWKGPAGTSIASNPVHEAFHRAITERAAENEFFSGHLLLLDQQPIAYVMGMLYNGVFLDLKESYRNTFREMSPGHVLKNFLFARLYERKVLLYDFMGNCEEYKMKWTDRTYCRVTYLFFNKTLRGKAAGWLSLLRPTKPKTNLPASMKNAPNTMKGKEGLQSASDSKDGDRCGKTVSV